MSKSSKRPGRPANPNKKNTRFAGFHVETSVWRAAKIQAATEMTTMTAATRTGLLIWLGTTPAQRISILRKALTNLPEDLAELVRNDIEQIKDTVSARTDAESDASTFDLNNNSDINIDEDVDEDEGEGFPSDDIEAEEEEEEEDTNLRHGDDLIEFED